MRASTSFMQGKRVSHFEIFELLGSGGMGVVYKARDLTLGRAVALKFLPSSVADDDKDRQRFLREARAASALNHPNICTIHEVGEDGDGQLFLCMELCEGETLKARLERGPLPLEEALDVAIQVASGLARAHQAGIVHRDVKPGNIVVNGRKVKILDFGLALVTGDPRLTRAGSAVGTVAYMSPEQVRGGEIDARSDLWSLGAVLFEMLTGRVPFEGPSEPEILKAILSEEPMPLAKVKPGLPHDLDRLLARLLAKDPADRIASAPALEQELRQVRQGMDSQEVTRTWGRPLRKTGKRRLRLEIAVLLGIAALSGLAFVLRSLGRNEAPQSVQNLAVLPFENLTGDRSRDYFGDGLSAVLIGKLSEVPGLNVVSRSEISSYQGSHKKATQIAKELGAQKILEGQVMEVGERVRVVATLVDGETGSVLWSYDREAKRGEIFGLQDRLAGEVVKALSLSLNVAARRRLTAKPTDSLEAYDFYLQARSLVDDRDHPEDLDSAAELFRRALEIDPNFALAHAGLSEALLRTYLRDKDRTLLTQARRQAERALAIDPTLPSARIALAAVDRSTGRVPQSIRELRRLVALHPELDMAWFQLAVTYQDAGERSKAEMMLRRAITIRPDFWSYWNQLGSILQEQGDYAGAREAYEKAIGTTPSEFSFPFQNLAALELERGNFAAAIEIYKRIPRPITNPGLAGNIGFAYLSAGRLDEAEGYIRQALRLQPKNHLWHYHLAELFHRRGNGQAASGEYRTAAQLVGEELEINSGREDLQMWRALYLAKAGDCGEALPLIRRLDATLQPDAMNSWDIAQGYALCDQRAPALAAIHRAVENGHAAADIPRQEEFKALLNDPALKELIRTASTSPQG